METEPLSAPDSEAELNDDHEQAKQRVKDYSERYLELKRRKDRSLVKTRDGLRIGDPDIREEWRKVSGHMDSLLARLFKENVKLGLDVTEKAVSDIQTADVVTPDTSTTIRLQLAGEPIPEFHDEYIIILPDEDLGKGRKF